MILKINSDKETDIGDNLLGEVFQDLIKKHEPVSDFYMKSHHGFCVVVLKVDDTKSHVIVLDSFGYETDYSALLIGDYSVNELLQNGTFAIDEMKKSK